MHTGQQGRGLGLTVTCARLPFVLPSGTGQFHTAPASNGLTVQLLLSGCGHAAAASSRRRTPSPAHLAFPPMRMPTTQRAVYQLHILAPPHCYRNRHLCPLLLEPHSRATTCKLTLISWLALALVLRQDVRRVCQLLDAEPPVRHRLLKPKPVDLNVTDTA